MHHIEMLTLRLHNARIYISTAVLAKGNTEYAKSKTQVPKICFGARTKARVYR